MYAGHEYDDRQDSRYPHLLQCLHAPAIQYRRSNESPLEKNRALSSAAASPHQAAVEIFHSARNTPVHEPVHQYSCHGCRYGPNAHAWQLQLPAMQSADLLFCGYPRLPDHCQSVKPSAFRAADNNFFFIMLML